MVRGRFISLEGGEGVGKSTQAVLLAETLRERAITVITTREPGGTPGAEAIRSLLLSGAGDRWQPRAEALLFAAARSDHVARVIEPALARGEWVVCDRFVDSSRAYQGSALGDAAVMALHREGSGGLLPDRTILLDAGSADVAARLFARDGESADRIGGRDSVFHDDVRAAFHTLATQEPDRFYIVNADEAPQEVAKAVLAALADLLTS